MNPTDLLKREHLFIERALDVLAAIRDALGKGAAPPAADITELLAFLQGYADDLHHLKEERCLFVALGRAGMPAEGGPVAVMLHEHDLGRELLRKLVESTPAISASDAERRAFCRNASRYVELLREHIGKENGILFPMAERLLPRSVKEEVLQRFAAIDEPAQASGALARFEHSLAELERRHGTGVSATVSAVP